MVVTTGTRVISTNSCNFLLALAMGFSLTACSGNTTEVTKESETTVLEETETETIDESESKEVLKQEAYHVIEAEVGQPFQIDAKYGSYIVTVTGIEETDWWERKHNNHVKDVILLHYEVENINFDSILSSGVQLNPDSFRITASNDYVAKAFNTYYDGYEAVGNVEPGEKQSGSMAYEIDKLGEYYEVVFKNSSGDIARVKVEP